MLAFISIRLSSKHLFLRILNTHLSMIGTSTSSTKAKPEPIVKTIARTSLMINPNIFLQKSMTYYHGARSLKCTILLSWIGFSFWFREILQAVFFINSYSDRKEDSATEAPPLELRLPLFNRVSIGKLKNWLNYINIPLVCFNSDFVPFVCPLFSPSGAL